MEKEYFTISEILSLDMDSFSDWKQMRMWYIQRLEQIRELVDRNRFFLETVEHVESAHSCASSRADSMNDRDYFVGTEQRIQEKEIYFSELDALEVIDDDASAVADAKSVALDIAAVISEASMDTLSLNDQEKMYCVESN